MIPPYPLAWPEGLPRSDTKFTSQFRTSLSAALENVRKSLTAFGADTGKKATDSMRYRHSGRPGGLTATPIGVLLARDPRKAVELAVWGMLPKNKLSRQIIGKLKVYSGPEHPHAAQKPQAFEITQIAQ